uniref:Uncharacterized protein n=1 Tax=Rousettus aegyptiacus TaxID=9407 RepID=A0A7J8K5I4_ROUAE|nr:hypothetical protein HJG63_001771 [Rousettus aegyptiacus]
MKQLQASDGAKATQLPLCQRKAGNMVLHSSGPGRATAHGLGMVAQAPGLPWEQGHGSLQKAGGRLALRRALLLWRRRLSLCQRATSFFQGTQRQELRHTLRVWCWRVWHSGHTSGNAWTASAPEPLGSVPGGEASLGCSSLGKGPFQRLPTTPIPRVNGLAGQQFLQGQYRRWVQVHLQGPQRAVFRGWQQVAARRRHTVARSEQRLLQSHFQAWRGLVRRARTLQAQQRAFRDGLRRRALGAAFAMWREGQAATARAREQRVARASIAHWRSHMQGLRADKQQGRAQAQQAFVAWRGALARCCEARQRAEERAQAQAQAQSQAALCWTLWVRESHLHRLGRAHAARKLSTRVLEAWARSAAQGQVQRVAIARFQQAGLRLLLQTHWAQWRTVLLRVWLEPRAEATQSRRPQATGPVLPGPAQQRFSLGGQRKWRETSWAQRHPPAPVPTSSSGLEAPAGPRAGPLQHQERTAHLRPVPSRPKARWKAAAGPFHNTPSACCPCSLCLSSTSPRPRPAPSGCLV